MFKNIIGGLFTIGTGVLTYSYMTQLSDNKSYTFNPDIAPAQFTNTDMIEHTLHNPNMKVSEAEINTLYDQVKRTRKRLGGEDRQKMLAYLSQQTKAWDTVVKKEGITGITSITAHGPTCWNAGIRYRKECDVCWDCGRRHI